jgi:hypothetical protein
MNLMLRRLWQVLLHLHLYLFGARGRFAIMAGTEWKRLWTFGTVEKRWYTLPFSFLPMHYDTPVAGDGGLLCCKRPLSYRGDQVLTFTLFTSTHFSLLTLSHYELIIPLSGLVLSVWENVFWRASTTQLCSVLFLLIVN